MAAKQAINEVQKVGDMLPNLQLELKEINGRTALKNSRDLLGIIETGCTLDRQNMHIPSVVYDDHAMDSTKSCDSLITV